MLDGERHKDTLFRWHCLSDGAEYTKVPFVVWLNSARAQKEHTSYEVEVPPRIIYLTAIHRLRQFSGWGTLHTARFFAWAHDTSPFLYNSVGSHTESFILGFLSKVACKHKSGSISHIEPLSFNICLTLMRKTPYNVYR